MEIFKLFGSILVDSEQADKSIQKTDENAKGLASSLGSGLKTVGKAAAGIATAAAGAATAAGAALNSLVNDTATYADTIDKASFRSGLGAENLQRIKYAAEQSGASLDNIEKSAKKVNDRLGEVSEGNKTTAEMFEKLGVAVYDADGNMRSSDEVYNDILLKLADMGDTAEATAIGTDLFGKAFTDLKPLLAAGSDGITDLMDNADALGIVMSQENVTAGVKFGDTMADVKSAVSGAVRSVGTALLPSFQKFADKLIEMIPKIQGFFEKLIPVVEELADSIITPLLDMIDDVFPDLMDFVKSLIDPVTSLIQSILPVIVELLEKLLPVATRLIEKLLPPLLDILDALMPLIDLAMELLEPILDLVLALIDPIADILNTVKPLVTALVDFIGQALEPIQEKLDVLAPFLETVLGGALKVVSGLLTDVLLPAFDGLLKFLNGDFLGGISDWGNAFTGVFDSIFAGIDEMFGTHLSEWYDGVKSFWMDLGSNIYEMTHGDEIELQELGRKYSTMRDDLNDAIKAAIYGGASVDEAVKKAKAQVLDSSEKVYYYDKVSAGWNLDEVAQDYYRDKDKPVPTALKMPEKVTANQWIAEKYSSVPKLATGGLVSGRTLALVGDNSDAAVNPEVVAPLADLSAMISGAFSRALDSFAERLGGNSGGSRQPVVISVQLSDSTELARALIDDFNEIARQDGASPFKGI